MKSFKEYLKEDVQQTKREGIDHLQKMKDLEFIDFFKKIQKDFGGKLKNIPVQLKVDGLGFRIGKDSNGKTFVESSRSGPVYDEGSFSKFTLAKGTADQVSIERAGHYDDILKFFKNSKLTNDLPNDTKVVVEVFYNPLANKEDDWITFVTVKYDKNKLGSLMTLFPHKVLVASTGETHPDEKQILESLYKMTNSEVKILNPYLSTSDIDLSGYLKPLDLIDDKVKEILVSRKATDKQEKESIKAVIQKIKDDLAEFIINHPGIKGKDMLGPNIEGLIMNINGKWIKTTTPEFKASKAK